MDEQTVTIPVETLNEMMAILGQQPFQQVAGIIQKVQADVQRLNQQPDLKAVENE